MSRELTDLAMELAHAVDDGRLSRPEAEQQLGRRAFDVLLPTDREPLPSEYAHPDPRPRDSELASVLRHLAELGDPDDWKPAPEYASTALAAIDAI